MSSVEQKYKYMHPEDAVVKKDWAAGTTDIVSFTDYIYSDNKLNIESIRYPPAWLKAIIDEPLVNAIDHFIRCYGSNQPVTEITVNFNRDGIVTVSNNGKGIEIIHHPVANMYVPQLIYGILNQGEHTDKDSASITGGTNGIGAKLGNCFSNTFLLETVSYEHDQGHKGLCAYIQKWTNGMKNVEAPMIIPHDKIPASMKYPHTKLTMYPDYKGIFKYDAFDENVYATLNKLIHTRMVIASAFIHYANNIRGQKHKISLKYNGAEIGVKSMYDIAKMICPGGQIFTTLAQPCAQSSASHGLFKYPWEVTVIIDDTLPDHLRTLSNVNGMIVRGGAHIKYISGILQDDVRAMVAKEIKDASVKLPPQYFSNNIVILLNTQVPGAKWNAQAKDNLNIPEEIRKQLAYTIDKKFLGQLSGGLKDHILTTLLNRKKKTKSKSDFHKKHKPANLIRGANFHKYAPKCSLLCTEGDSAETQVRIGITERLSTDYYGTLGMRGVIMNARKKSKVITAGGVTHVKKLPVLEKNQFVNALADIVGLNDKYKYDPSTQSYKNEIKQLRYGRIIVCVDQDEDGMNILGLFINMFERLWPNLLAAGFVQWWQTPLIRAYPNGGGTIEEFYNESDYQRFLNGPNVDISKYEVHYYKGIGTHEREEILHMFDKFNSNVCTILSSTKSRDMLEIYYGNVPSKRKQVLRLPYKELSSAAKQARIDTCKVLCDEILAHEVDGSQRYNISRKLDHAIDGMNLVGRKIYAACYKIFNVKNKQMKVSQLAGFVSQKMEYHHGEDCLHKSITGKAFVTVGGKQLPPLVPLSQFGTRMYGGKDAASARYIFTKFNKRINNIIYPPEDFPNLQYTESEGKCTEPVCYYPIIPMAILESTEIPAHGWKLKTWARNVHDVINNVKFMINSEDHSRLFKMRPDTYGWRGRIGNISGVEASFGEYIYDSETNKLIITELPLRVWTRPYVNMLEDKSESDDRIIDKVTDKSNDNVVRIEVDLKPGAMSILDELGTIFTDGVEEYFQLREKMNADLNYLGINKEVIEFKNYDDIMRYWFPYRQDQYRMRIERNLIILNLELEVMKSKYKYINSGINVSRMSKKAQDEVLSEANYVRYNTGALRANKHIPTHILRDTILTHNASYEYLLVVSDSKKSTEAIEKLATKISDKENEIKKYIELSSRGRFPGAEIWLQELDMLEVEIKIGRPTKWLYEDKKKKYKFK
jgi:DNA topoisomerase-2